MQKKWTIIVVPNSTDEGFNVTIGLQSLRIGLLSLCLLAVIILAVSVNFILDWRHGYMDQIARLERRAKASEARLAGLNSEFKNVLILEDKLRAIAGLEPRHEIQGKAGMGGQENPELMEAEYMPPEMEEAIPYPPSFIADETAMDTDTFLEAILSARDSFSEILVSFEKEQDRLSSIPSINPVYSPDAWISSGYGYRKDPINGARRFHDGMDIVAPRKTPVIAPAKGKVMFAGWRDGLGRMVEIKHGYGYSTIYGHNDKLTVKKGDTVERGDTIALLGSSGRSTGPHLHYELRKDGKLLNPYRYVIE
jgi:murein DD-endopeptidase MepM/ murein hydrolase activator NlpD